MATVRLWLPLVAALSGGCDRLFGVDTIGGTSDPVFVRADHLSLADGHKQQHVTATLSQADAGDLMVVAICSIAENPIMRVTDVNGTSYANSSGAATVVSGLQSDVYFALITKSVSGFSVGIDFANDGASNPDVRLLEYQNALVPTSASSSTGVPDLTSGGSGDSRTLDVSVAVSAVPSLVLFTDCVRTYTIAPFDPQFQMRVQTSPNGDTASDLVARTAGPITGTVVADGATGGILASLHVFAGVTAP